MLKPGNPWKRHGPPPPPRRLNRYPIVIMNSLGKRASRQPGQKSTLILVAFLTVTLLLLISATLLPLGTGLSSIAAAHLVLAVGIMTLVTAVIQYFVPVLTRSEEASPQLRLLPIFMLVAGLLATLVFAGTIRFDIISVAAAVGMMGSVLMSGWMRHKASRAVGRPHPGLDWYLWAMGCLGAALAAAALIPWLPQWYAPLRAFHVHMNLYGFIGLTALGTLQVLMPTVAEKQDPEASTRLRQDLKWCLGGALLLALGEAGLPYAPWVGLIAWARPLLRLTAAWCHLYRQHMFALHGNAPALFAALLGFELALITSPFHLGQPLTLFLPGFLFPLLVGAAGYLVPVWLRPGIATQWHMDARRYLARYGGIRAMLFLASALLPSLGVKCSAVPGLIALCWFLCQFGVWFLLGAVASRPDHQH